MLTEPCLQETPNGFRDVDIVEHCMSHTELLIGTRDAGFMDL